MKKFILSLAVAVCAMTAAKAEVVVSGGADFVSDYVWRGADQGSGVSIQPGVEVSAGNFSVSAWGNQSLTKKNVRELDFTVGYSLGSLSVAYTNYWWAGGDDYFAEDSHYSEVALSYEFGESFPLAITWSTMVAGKADNLNKNGDEAFSTYIDFSYPFAISGVDCTANVGITPWNGMYSGADKDGNARDFAVSSVGLNFSKAIIDTENFSLPMFVDVSFSPAHRNAYLVAGMSFGF